MSESSDDLWRKRFQLFMLVRLFGRGDVPARDRHRLHRFAPDGRLAAGRRAGHHRRRHRRRLRAAAAAQAWQQRMPRRAPGSQTGSHEAILEGSTGGPARRRLGGGARRPTAQDAGEGGAAAVPSETLAASHREGMGRGWRDRRPARHAADRARQCRHRPRRAGPGHVSPRAWRNMARPTCSATAPSRQRGWSSGRRGNGIRCSPGRGGGSTSTSASTAGITHVPQPGATVARLGHAVAALDPFRLAALSPLVTIGGSLVAALAVLEEAVPAEEAWRAVSLDERWQLEQWGSDAEAEAALDEQAARFPRRGGLPGAARLALR